MYDSLLVPTDGSAPASAAVAHAFDLAAATDATVHVLYVADTSRDSVTVVGVDVVDALEREGEDVVAEIADRGRARGVDVVTEVLQGTPAETIVDYAAARGVDLVVMGTAGREGLEHLVVGSVTERVVRTCSVPVLTVRAGSEDR